MKCKNVLWENPIAVFCIFDELSSDESFIKSRLTFSFVTVVAARKTAFFMHNLVKELHVREGDGKIKTVCYTWKSICRALQIVILEKAKATKLMFVLLYLDFCLFSSKEKNRASYLEEYSRFQRN